MQLTIEIKSVYGVERIYAVCNNAKLITKLKNSKTLSKEDISILRDTSYQVKKVGEQWLIVNKYKDDAIGLTHKDNKTLNGNETDFFTGVKND